MSGEELTSVEVGALDTLADPGARGFSPPGARFPDDYFVVRRGEQIACFSNVCTHAGQPLNWAPDRFLDRSGELIVCPAHGATYDSLSGACRGGPCRGMALESWPVEVRGGLIVAHVPPARIG